MFALVDLRTGRVCQIEAEPFSVHPDLKWVEIPDGAIAETEGRFNGGFHRRPTPEVQVDRLAALEARVAALEARETRQPPG